MDGEGSHLLITLSAAMFGGSFFVGLIPLAFTMSEGRTRLLSVFGAGLLVGTALSVIIPEGVESLYLAYAGKYKRQNDGVAQNFDLKQQDIVGPGEKNKRTSLVHENVNIPGGKNPDIAVDRVERRKLQAADDPMKLIGRNPMDQRYIAHDHVDIAFINKSIGYSLVMGFIFMLIIDQITRSASSKAGERSRNKMTATIGLVVHSAADGVALGSAAATNRSDVQFIVFLAVMLHKAPAAFGLVSFLLVEGVEKFRIRRHLLMFSLAAPSTALVTFQLIAAVGSESISTDSATGILMLFSAGTFLYVATVHIIPELINNRSNYLHSALDSAGLSHATNSSLTLKELTAMIIGALCPTVLTSSHSH